VRDLTVGVHAGVGATRALEAHPLPREPAERFFERGLHGPGGILLGLPAVEARADVRDHGAVAHRGRHDTFGRAPPAAALGNTGPDRLAVPMRMDGRVYVVGPAIEAGAAQP
jgi:hypothetical protein